MSNARYKLVIPKLQAQIRNLEREVEILKQAHVGRWPFAGKIEFFAFRKRCELHIDKDGAIDCPDKHWILEKAHEEYGEHIVLELGPGRSTEKLKCLTVGLNVSADSLCDIYIDLEYGLSFLPDNSITKIHSNQFLEHLQNLISHMNECWRVLMPGGSVEACVPHRDSPWAVADPTHKRTFVPESFRYFCIDKHTGEPFVDAFSDYGIKCAFLLEQCRSRPRVDIQVVLRKP